VSQIASFTFVSFSVRVVVLKSIPIVAGVSFWNLSSTNRNSRQDLCHGHDYEKKEWFSTKKKTVAAERESGSKHSLSHITFTDDQDLQDGQDIVIVIHLSGV
jgi:hypothetical protein